MGANITLVSFRIAQGALGNAGHVAVDAFYVQFHMGLVVLSTGLFLMAVFTLCARGLQTLIAQLNDTLMGIMANDAVNSHMLALEQLFILLMVLDEAAAGIYFFLSATPMAIAASITTAVDFQGK